MKEILFSEKELDIIDANIDRAREGIRVCEDIVRFVLEDKKLMNALKEQRHSCTKALQNSGITPLQLFNARKKRKDIGQKTFSEGEKTRKTQEDLLLANFTRTQESFRVLEELFKKSNPKTAFQFKQLRFKNYELQNEVMLSYERNKKIKQFEEVKLYPVLTLEKESAKTYLKISKQLISAGVNILQLRPHALSDKKFLSIAKKLRELTAKKKILFIIDNRADIAAAVNADGVHLGQADMSVKECRKIIGFDKLIGKSTHSKKQINAAVKEEPDYISTGPVFHTESVPYKIAGLKIISHAKKQKITAAKNQIIPSTAKQKIPFAKKLKISSARKKKLEIPFVAVGGINESNIKQVKRKGAERVAVITALTKAKNPAKTAKKLISLIK